MMLRCMSPEVADFVAEVGYGRWIVGYLVNVDRL